MQFLAAIIQIFRAMATCGIPRIKKTPDFAFFMCSNGKIEKFPSFVSIFVVSLWEVHHHVGKKV